MNYYPFHLGDYASHTAHLTPLEDICYRRMLDLYYIREAPLPKDPTQIARLIRMADSASLVEAVLGEFFQISDDGYHNTRADAEISSFKRMAEGGKKGAAMRWSKPSHAHPMPTPCPPHENPNANQNQNHNQNQNNSVTNVTGAKAPLSPDEIIFGYGLPLLTNAGTAEKQARSFLGGLRKSHGDDALIDALRECIKAKPMQPLEWLAKVLPPKGGQPKMNKQEALEASNRAVAERLLKKEGLM